MKSLFFSIALVLISLISNAQYKFGVFGAGPLYVNIIQEYTIPATATEPVKAHISWSYTADPDVTINQFGVYRNVKNGFYEVSSSVVHLTDITINSADVPIKQDPKENVIVVLFFTDHGTSYSNQLKIRL